MKKLAKNLCGTDIGRTLTHHKIVLGRWDSETKTYPDRMAVPAQSVITMITHKKDGDVSVRVFPVTGDLRFQADAEVELS